MRKNLIDLFFKELDREWKRSAQIILTGAAAGALFGHVRPSMDVDFEIHIPKSKNRGTISLEEAIRRVSEKTGVQVNYSEDISHWSMIDFLDYRKKALPYKKMGRLEIKIMSPEYWTIGKMTRYLEIDIQDMVKIIKQRKVRPEVLIKLWIRALISSPLSLSLSQFRDHVNDFLKRYGKKLWGKSFDAQRAVTLFNQRIQVK